MKKCTLYNNAEEAKEHIALLEVKLKIILSTELPTLAEDQRSVGTWLSLFGKQKDRERTRKHLLDLERQLIDANLYLRHLVTQHNIDLEVPLLDTFH